MSQHDMVVDNASGATVRADINSALQALASTSKGNTRPSTVYAGQLWLDDNTPSGTVWTLYLYDGADDIPVAYVDTTNNYTLHAIGDGSAGAPALIFVQDTDTGMWRVAANTIGWSTGGSERMRLDTALRVGGSTAFSAGEKVAIIGSSTVGEPTLVSDKQAAGSAASNHILFNNSNGYVGSVTTSGSATAFNTSSDYRLKQNLAAIPDPLAKLAALKPYEGEFRAEPGERVMMFVAHEVAQVVPNAVFGRKDGTNPETGAPIYQAIDHSKLVPLLTAALQAAVAQIDALTARVAALEAA